MPSSMLVAEKARSDRSASNFKRWLWPEHLCSLHHGIFTGTNCCGIVAKASEQKLDPGPMITAEHTCSLKWRGMVKGLYFRNSDQGWQLYNLCWWYQFASFTAVAKGKHLLPTFLWFATFTVPKQSFISVLCLCTLNPGCVSQKECGAGGKKCIGFLKEIFHCVAETREPNGLLSVKAQNLRNKF